ncbi:MAG: hypothetical protein DRN14_04495, partial [Thermoplasmata archaeon]
MQNITQKELNTLETRKYKLKLDTKNEHWLVSIDKQGKSLCETLQEINLEEYPYRVFILRSATLHGVIVLLDKDDLTNLIATLALKINFKIQRDTIHSRKLYTVINKPTEFVLKQTDKGLYGVLPSGTLIHSDDFGYITEKPSPINVEEFEFCLNYLRTHKLGKVVTYNKSAPSAYNIKHSVER